MFYPQLFHYLQYSDSYGKSIVDSLRKQNQISKFSDNTVIVIVIVIVIVRWKWQWNGHGKIPQNMKPLTTAISLAVGVLSLSQEEAGLCDGLGFRLRLLLQDFVPSWIWTIILNCGSRRTRHERGKSAEGRIWLRPRSRGRLVDPRPVLEVDVAAEDFHLDRSCPAAAVISRTFRHPGSVDGANFGHFPLLDERSWFWNELTFVY